MTVCLQSRCSPQAELSPQDEDGLSRSDHQKRVHEVRSIRMHLPGVEPGVSSESCWRLTVWLEVRYSRCSSNRVVDLRVPTNPVSEKNAWGPSPSAPALKRLGSPCVESTLPLSRCLSLRPPGKGASRRESSFFGHMEVEVAGVEPRVRSIVGFTRYVASPSPGGCRDQVPVSASMSRLPWSSRLHLRIARPG